MRRSATETACHRPRPGQGFHHSTAQEFHRWDECRIQFIQQLEGSNALIFIKALEQHLTPSKYSRCWPHLFIYLFVEVSHTPAPTPMSLVPIPLPPWKALQPPHCGLLADRLLLPWVNPHMLPCQGGPLIIHSVTEQHLSVVHFLVFNPRRALAWTGPPLNKIHSDTCQFRCWSHDFPTMARTLPGVQAPVH